MKETGRKSTKHATAAFTLIELICAMAILLMIGVVIGKIFAGSEIIWTRTTIRTQKNADGRAALQMIAHDLQYAIAYVERDGTGGTMCVTFRMQENRDGWDSYDFTNSEINFVSLQHDSTVSPRTAVEIRYYLKEITGSPGQYELRRHYYSNAITTDSQNHCYWDSDWFASAPSAGDPLVESVAGFSVTTPDGSIYYDSRDHGDKLPPYVDVYLEILSPREAAEVADMMGVQPDTYIRDYVERKARRFTSRVYFQNRHGYKRR